MISIVPKRREMRERPTEGGRGMGPGPDRPSGDGEGIEAGFGRTDPKGRDQGRGDM